MPDGVDTSDVPLPASFALLRRSRTPRELSFLPPHRSSFTPEAFPPLFTAASFHIPPVVLPFGFYSTSGHHFISHSVSLMRNQCIHSYSKYIHLHAPSANEQDSIALSSNRLFSIQWAAALAFFSSASMLARKSLDRKLVRVLNSKV